MVQQQLLEGKTAFFPRSTTDHGLCSNGSLSQPGLQEISAVSGHPSDFGKLIDVPATEKVRRYL